MPKALDPALRRGELLDAAFDVFAREGYHALSMRDLARALGLTTGALYHWFDGKPAILTGLLERQVTLQVERALAAVGRVSADARVDALAGHIAAEADDLRRTLVVALDYHRAHPDGANALVAALRAYEDALVDALGLSRERARFVLSALLGELLQRTLDPTRALTRETLLRLLTTFHVEHRGPATR